MLRMEKQRQKLDTGRTNAGRDDPSQISSAIPKFRGSTLSPTMTRVRLDDSAAFPALIGRRPCSLTAQPSSPVRQLQKNVISAMHDSLLRDRGGLSYGCTEKGPRWRCDPRCKCGIKRSLLVNEEYEVKSSKMIVATIVATIVANTIWCCIDQPELTKHNV